MLAAMLGALLAQPGPCPGAVVTLDGDGWPAALAKAFEADLRVELERTKLCERREGEPPATIEAGWNGGAVVTMVVTFQHSDTERQLKRRLNGAGLPDDGLALALAAVAGELLDEVRQVLRPEPAPLAFAANLLALRAIGEGFTGGLLLGGADVHYRRSFGALSLGCAVGGRLSGAQTGPAGSVRTSVVSAALEASWHVVKSERWWVGLGGALDGAVVWLTPTAAAGFTAKAPATVFDASVSGVVSVELHLGLPVFFLRLGAGVPLRGFQVLETNTGVSGAQLSVAVGGGAAW